LNESPNSAPRVLFVDDEADIRKLLINLFKKDGRYELDTAADGRKGLEAVANGDFDLIVTDLKMPNLGGIEFIQELRKTHPHTPFIVFTGYGEIEDAIEALRLGAFNFLRKPWDLNQIIPAVEKALSVVTRTAKRARVFNMIRTLQVDIVLPPLLSEKDLVIEHLIDPLVPMGLADDSDVRNVFLALDEVINNAIVYGALEIDSSVRDEEDGHRKFHSLILEREKDATFRDREILVKATYSPTEAVFQITDPGKGFDYAHLPDPTDPANLMREHGRGLLLVQCFMDGLSFNPQGNEVTLIKKHPSAVADSASF
jgi:CheY-like chemotaxis protein